MAIQRTCLGCGGSGESAQTRATPIPDGPTRGHHWRCGTCHGQNSDMDGTCQFCECLGVACTRGSCDDPRHFQACLACLGFGQITDRIGAEDAVVDAETLRVNVGINDYSPEFQCWVGSPSTFALHRAVQNADMAIRGAIDFCRERGELAARAAFRAVPGLRG